MEGSQEVQNSPETKEKKGLAGGRGKETLFRVSARNQIEMIAIADNKANIITGINVVLISVTIAFFGSGASFIGRDFLGEMQLIIPFGILLITCLTSAIYAIFSAKPKFIVDTDKSHRSLTFFQNYYQKSLDEYIEEVHTVLESRKAVYDQIIMDMYNNGLVLHRKYQLLIYSYNIFMFGLVLSVLSFLVIILLP